MHSHHFKEISLLITHYNRSHSLERLLKRFQELQCEFAEIVVSDDGSRAEHVEHLHALQKEYQFTLLCSSVNKGLGNNINKGQDAVNTPYTLYVQEDFVPADIFPEKLQEAGSFMDEDPALDMVRFYAYFKYPYLRTFRSGFSRMVFSIWYPGYRKFYYYSDHPHLRRSSFLTKFGRYDENNGPDKTEYKMMMSFLQTKGKGLFYDDYRALFTQANSSAEPSTVHRNFWRESNNPIVTMARHLYRHIKFNFDIQFKSKN